MAKASASPSIEDGSNSTSGTKRKRESGPKFYAVRAGYRPGVYSDWNECLGQVKGFRNALYKSFSTLSDAEQFVSTGRITSRAGPSKFYGVRGGRQPGVYTDWPTVQNLITGWKGIKQKSFTSKVEAEAFVRGENVEKVEGNDEAQRKKKARKSNNQEMIDLEAIDEAVEAGTGPMPPVSADGFDSRIKLNRESGKVQYRTDKERQALKMHAVGPVPNTVLNIYTDGSALGNGRDGATAGVGVYFGPLDQRNLSEPLEGSRQTNQRAELTAIQRALELAPRDRPVMIHSDSNYAIKCVTEWFIPWKRNGWMTAGRKAVENRDLIEIILAKIDERNMCRVTTKFTWIKGHANDAGNNAADALAVKGAYEARAG